MATGVAASRATRRHYPDPALPPAPDWLDLGTAALAVAGWLLAGFLIRAVMAGVSRFDSPESLCRPLDYFPIRFAASR